MTQYGVGDVCITQWMQWIAANICKMLKWYMHVIIFYIKISGVINAPHFLPTFLKINEIFLGLGDAQTLPKCLLYSLFKALADSDWKPPFLDTPTTMSCLPIMINTIVNRKVLNTYKIFSITISLLASRIKSYNDTKHKQSLQFSQQSFKDNSQVSIL